MRYSRSCAIAVVSCFAAVSAAVFVGQRIGASRAATTVESSYSDEVSYGTDPGASIVRAGGTTAYSVDFTGSGQTDPWKTITRLEADGSKTRWMPFPDVTRDARVTGIYVQRDGTLFCSYYNPHGADSSFTRIARAEYGKSLNVLWATASLVVRSFAVSEQGLIYVMGYDPYLEKLAVARDSDLSTTVNSLHIIDPAKNSDVGLLPATVTKRGLSYFIPLLSEANISVRPNGNFFVTFRPEAAKAGAFASFLAKDVVELAPDGSTVHVYGLDLRDPDAYVAAVFVDNDASLLVQVVSSTLAAMQGGYRIKYKDNYLVRVLPTGATLRLPGRLPDGVLVQGWKADTKTLVLNATARHAMSMVSVTY